MDGFWSTVIGIVGGLATILGVGVTFYRSRGENQSARQSAKAALDARIDARVEAQLTKAWNDIDTLKNDFKALETRESRRTGAITRILRAIAAQWPTGIQGPDLNPEDIKEIEETIPTEWIRKSPKLS